jgi:predicted benzoate:H+ symporter BenE
MNDAQHPFFTPLWRRIAVVAFCVAWSVFEFTAGTQFWGTVAGGMAIYAAWMFLLNYKPPAEPTEGQPPAEKE